MLAPEPIFESRGTPISITGRLKALSDLGHKVDLVTYPLGNNISFENLTIIRSYKFFWIKEVPIGFSFTKVVLDIFLFFKAIKALKQLKYDLIFSHEEASYFGVVFSNYFKIPHLYDMHSSIPQQLCNYKLVRLTPIMGILNWFEKSTLKSAECVITICEDLERHIRLNAHNTHSLVIENTLDTILFTRPNCTTSEILDRYNLKDKRVFLYAGNLEHYQGLDLIVESAKIVVNQMDNCRFMIVGGKGKKLQKLQKKIDQIGLTENFIFTGQVPIEDMTAYISCADLLLSPRSSGTNTPLKIYSYLKSGKPILATDLLTHTQVLNDDVAILSEPIPEEFSKKMLLLKEHPELLSLKARNAQAMVKAEYSYKKYLDKISQALALATN